MPIVRRSRKRDAILARMRSTRTHPTAEWIYKELKGEYPDLSLGTVYRNLNQLCEEGYAIRIGVVNGQERFDACVTPHAHFICEGCGRVLDLPDSPPPEGYIESLSQSMGLRVNGYEFKLHGLCDQCQHQEA